MARIGLGRVLVVDDEVQLMDALVEALTAQGYQADGYRSGEAALHALQRDEFELLLTDLMMPGMDGLTLLKAGMAIDPHLVGIIMTGQGTVPTAVAAMKTGAFDYIQKPFRLETILPVLARAMEVRQLRLENIQLRETVAIHDLSQAIASTLDSELVLQKTADAALLQVDADEVSILRLGPGNQDLYIAAVRGRGREHLLGGHISLQQGVAGWVARHAEPLILNGEVSDPRFAPIQPRPEIQSAISMPMMTAGKLTGVLNVNSLQARRPFKAGQLKALSILTSTAAAALENESLFKALEASEKRFRSLVENISDVIVLLDEEGRITYTTPAAQKVLGYTPSELEKRRAFDLIHPDDLPGTLDIFARALSQPGSTADGELRIVRKDGDIRWVQVLGTNLLDEPGVGAVVSVYRDITERKIAEEKILISEERLKLATRIGRVGVWDWDIVNDVLTWDESMYELYGMDKNDFEGVYETWTRTLHPDDREFVEGEIQAAFRNEREYAPEFRIILPDGNVRILKASSQTFHDQDGKALRMVGTNIDITERRQAEAELHLRGTALKSTANGIVITDSAGTIQWVNPAFTRLTGYSVDEAVGRNPRIIKSDRHGQPFYKTLWDTILAGKIWQGGMVNKRKDGSLYIEEQTITPIIDRNGKITHFIAIKQDVTERRRAEEALLKSQKTFSVIFNKAPFAAALAGVPDGAYLEVNEEFERVVGYSRQEVIGKTSLELGLYPDPEVRALNAAQFQEQGFVHNLEVQLRTRSGELRHLLVNTDAVEIGDQQHILTTAQDITERKQAEEAVRASEEQYRSLFEDSPISLWVEDFSEAKLRLDQLQAGGVQDIPAYLLEHPDFVSECARQVRVVDVNSAAVKLYHASSKAELLGRLVDVLPTLPVEQIERQLMMICNGQLNYEREAVEETLTGEKIHVNLRWTVAPGYEDTFARVIVSTIDVTERKRAEEQTRLQIERLKALRAIDTAISSSFNLNLTLDILLDQVIAQLGTDAAAVLLFHPSTGTLEYAASRGFYSTAIRETRVRLGEGHAGRAILERHMIHIPNLPGTGSELDHARSLKNENFIEYYCVPLFIKGEVKGVLEIYHRAPLAGNAEWLDFLETLAGQAAIAIDNATLFEGLQHSSSELFQAYDATIEGWSHALDLRDKETEGHSLRVTEMTITLAHNFDFSDEQLRYVRWGALLHDIGKMGVPDSILLKPDKLNDDEWERMKQHPVFALEMLSPIDYLKPALDIPYCHHEKWDGTGYPRGLKGEVIPLAARLFAIVDVWDALRSDRPYRQAWSVEKTVEHIRSLSGTHFDPQVVEHFLGMIKRAN